MKTYKVLSALLDYPSAALVAALPELQVALDHDGALLKPVRVRLDTFFRDLESKDLLDAQEQYVALFDRVRSLSLNLFEHVHGESRDRGQALVDLRALYARSGLDFVGPELPDHLPAFLEFLSRLEPVAAKELLGETVHVLESIAARLAKRASPYAAVFEALLALAERTQVDSVPFAPEEADEDDLAALDAQWEEQPAFGPGPGCAAAQPRAPAVVRIHKRAA
jgi:nitrate reductase delta subunit